VPFRRVLVLGGARSGKSSFAERLAAEAGLPVVYVATATAGDDEMAERIALHRAQRPAGWRTLELPTGVAAGVAAAITQSVQSTIVIEDLTFLLANLMGEDEIAAEHAAIAEVEALLTLRADIILVSNEVGMGLVPPYPLGRLFRDALGRVNQFVAGACGEVYVLFAGLPLQLK
jgi:adenosylcobinamide kinase/adenosylcobinamide-phosphate guanylyltransferase